MNKKKVLFAIFTFLILSFAFIIYGAPKNQAKINVAFLDSYTDTIITQQTIKMNAAVKVPKAPKHEGYVFEGWYLYGSDTKITDFQNIAKDLKVEAKYIAENKKSNGNENVTNSNINNVPNLTIPTQQLGRVNNEPNNNEDDTVKYDIKFVIDGKGSLTGEQEFKSLLDGSNFYDNVVIPTPTAEEGYKFVGWNPALPEESSRILANVTYTAVFEDVTVPILEKPIKYENGVLAENSIINSSKKIIVKQTELNPNEVYVELMKKDSEGIWRKVYGKGYKNVNEFLFDIDVTNLEDDTYQIKFSQKDSFNNKSGHSYTFKVDTTMPTVEVSYSTKQLINKDIIVSLKFSEEVKAIEGWTQDQTDKTVWKKTYSANATETVNYEDLAGNPGEPALVIINNIDKNLPEINYVYYKNDWQEKAWSTGTSKTNPTTSMTVRFKVLDDSDIEVVKVIWTNNYNVVEGPTKLKKAILNNINLEGLVEVTKGSDGYYRTTSPANLEGLYKLGIVAVDKAGNKKAWPGYDMHFKLPDLTPPTVEVKYSTKTLTNQDVLVSLEFSEEVKPIEGWTQDETDKTVWKKTYSANATETVNYEDLVGNPGEPALVIINNIDKNSPEINYVYYKNDWQEKAWSTGTSKTNPTTSMTVRFKVLDDSDIEVVKVIWTNEFNVVEGSTKLQNAILNNLESLEEVTKGSDGYYRTTSPANIEGLYKLGIVAVDKAGNKKAWPGYDMHFKLPDLTPPTVEVKYSTKTLTNQDVLVSLEFSEEVKPIEGWTQDGTEKTIWKKTYGANAIETVNYKDLAGNPGEAAIINIENIDKERPVITFSGNNPLVLGWGDFTFNPLKNGAVKAVDNRDGNITNNVIITSDNLNIWEKGTYSITYKVTDQAGNTTEATRTIEVKGWF